MTGFDQRSTAEEVLAGIDLAGKRVLITGVSAGLGLETARVLAEHGAEVVGTARDLEKARKAMQAFSSGNGPGAKLSLVELDLSSLKSIRRCTDLLNDEGKKFDVIIANAGVMACPQDVTEDGFETQIGTNFLGHFVLINRLVPLIKDGGRIVNVSSMAHRFSDVYIDDLNIEHRPYVEFKAYGSSKTAVVLFTVELDRRLKARGIRAAALHPGGIRTELQRHVTPEVASQIPGSVAKEYENGRVVEKSLSQGAATSVWCGFVADGDLIGGKYCEDCQVAPVIDDPDAAYGVTSYAIDPEKAKLLWKKGEEMVGETFNF